MAPEYKAIEPKRSSELKRFHWWDTPLKFRPGPPYSRNDPGVWKVYSHSTRRAEHAHMCETYQRVTNSEIKALWSCKLWPKNDTFFSWNANFLGTGGDLSFRSRLKLTHACNVPRQCFWRNITSVFIFFVRSTSRAFIVLALRMKTENIFIKKEPH